MKKITSILILLSLMLTNNAKVTNKDLNQQIKQNFDLNYSESEPEQFDEIQNNYEGQETINQQEFIKLQRHALSMGLSGVCLVIGIVILFNKLLS